MKKTVSKSQYVYNNRPLNTMAVGDVDRTLCKHKETVPLYGERNTLNRLGTAFYSKIRLEHFEIIIYDMAGVVQ